MDEILADASRTYNFSISVRGKIVTQMGFGDNR